MICTNRSPNQNCVWRLTPIAAAICSLGLISSAVNAEPQGGVVRAGAATIAQSGSTTRIDQGSERAVIDWRSFGVSAGESVLFRQPSRSSATLNRVTGEQLSMILGRIEANGRVVLINPNGILFGQGAQVNVGSLIASTANISNASFMAGRLRFDEPGRPGAGIINQGSISAADGGLIALVAPHVRNDGMIQARLGKVLVGAGDTFTLDLYGDGLISLAIAPEHGNALLDETGQQIGALVSHTGKIIADGGQVVLITAPGAKAVLDEVINLSGTIQADTVAQQGGRIVLQGRGGAVDVTGTLSAQGKQTGQGGGMIEVLGDAVHLAVGAQIDASGQGGGGTLHVGGAFQGQGSTYRADTTRIDAGVQLKADAMATGKGGEVVVWADGNTTYAGQISARGGTLGGDGGRVEVSGKKTLDFLGSVDAGAASGAAGTLLLDPAYLTIGLAEASLINRVLRTGTTTTLAADVDINVNAVIDGRGRRAGGGLALSAGRDININDFIVTNNGLINLLAASGTVNVASGKGVFAGSAPILVRVGGNLSTAPILTSGLLSFVSTAGSVNLDTALDESIGSVSVSAARDVTINQPVVNLRNGSSFNAVAGRDVLVSAQLDGRGGSSGGAVGLTAGNNVLLNDHVVTRLGTIRARAIGGSIISAVGKGLYANGSAIDLVSGADLSTGILSTTGSISLASTSGSVSVVRGIDGTAGATSISAAVDANLDTEVLNMRSGAPLNVSAGRDVNVRAQVDGRGGVTGGSAALTAGRNVNISEDIATHDGAVNLVATSGTVIQSPGTQVRSSTAPISVSAGGNLTSASYVTTGSLDIRSTGGSVTVAEPIYDTIGATTISAADNVNINRLVENVRTLASLGVIAGNDINVSAQIGQDRLAITDTGPITLVAGHDVNVSEDVVSRNAPLVVQGTTGTVRVVAGKQLRSGNGSLTVTAGSNLYVGNSAAAKPNVDTPYITSGALNVSSSSGTLYIEAPIPDSTGPVNLFGGHAVVVNERIYSNNQSISITAGTGGIVMNAATIQVPSTVNPPTEEILLSDTDARLGNLILLAQGDISAPSLRTAGTLSVTSTAGHILGGRIYGSRFGNGVLPSQVRLAAAQGVDSFNTDNSPEVEARSSAGSVNITVFAPQRLFIDAALDARTGGWIGNAAELVAGQDVILTGVSSANLVRASAGRDFWLNGGALAGALKVVVGRDIQLPAAVGELTWIEGPGGAMTLKNVATPGAVETIRGLSFSAGRDALIAHPVHVSDSLSAGTETTYQPTSVNAGRNVTLGQLETIGSVTINATTGNIIISHPLGAPVPVLSIANNLWNPASLGVASLSLSAPGSAAAINLQGARSVGSLAVNAPNGSVASAYSLTSSNGPLLITSPIQSVSAVSIAEVARLARPAIVAPAVAPGPLRAAPDAPNIPAAPPPAAPALSEILVSLPGNVDPGGLGVPAASEELAEGTTVAQAAQAVTASDQYPGETVAGREGATASPLVGELLVYSGGRGLAQAADLGRSGAMGSLMDVFSATQPSEDERRRQADK